MVRYFASVDNRQLSVKELAIPDFVFGLQLHGTHWRTVSPGWAYPEHEHPLIELNLVISGQQMTEISGTPYLQSAGELLIIRPGERHKSSTVGEDELTYLCLHLDIDDDTFAQRVYSLPSTLYPSDSTLARNLRPFLDKLIKPVDSSELFRREDQLHVRIAILNVLLVLGELSALMVDTSRDDTPPFVSETSSETIRYREHKALEKKVQDLFHEPILSSVYIEESMFPRYRWMGVFSISIPDKNFWTITERFRAKNVLEEALELLGTAVIVVEEPFMTAVIFSNQVAVPPIEEQSYKCQSLISHELNVDCQLGFGGITADMIEIGKLYKHSLRHLDADLTDANHSSYEFVHRVVRLAMLYMETEYASSDLSLSYLAEKLGVTANYLSYLFSAETGYTFTQHLTKIRMDKAKKLLKESNLKIYLICEQIGYSDRAYFSRLFKTIVGMTPYDYRSNK